MTAILGLCTINLANVKIDRPMANIWSAFQMTTRRDPLFAGLRYAADVISYVVRLYF